MDSANTIILKLIEIYTNEKNSIINSLYAINDFINGK